MTECLSALCHPPPVVRTVTPVLLFPPLHLRCALHARALARHAQGDTAHANLPRRPAASALPCPTPTHPPARPPARSTIMMGMTRAPYLGAFDARRYDCPRLAAYGVEHVAPSKPLPPLDGVRLWDIRGRPSPPLPATADEAACASPARRASPDPTSAITSAAASPATRPSSPAVAPATTPGWQPPVCVMQRATPPWATAATSAAGRLPRTRPPGVRKLRAPKPKIAGQSRYWTNSEHRLFVEALSLYGTKDLKAIAGHVATRNQTQVRTHAQKWSMRLVREAKRACLGHPEMQPLLSAAGVSVPPLLSAPLSGDEAPGAREDGAAAAGGVSTSEVDVDVIGSKCSVPAQCGMALLCLVGQDTMPAAARLD